MPVTTIFSDCTVCCPGSGSGSGSMPFESGTVIVTCCNSTPIPKTLHLTVSSSTFPCLDGTWILLWSDAAGEWLSVAGAVTCNGTPVVFNLFCLGNFFLLGVGCNGLGTANDINEMLTCSPFLWTATITLIDTSPYPGQNCFPGGGTFNATVTA